MPINLLRELEIPAPVRLRSGQVLVGMTKSNSMNPIGCPKAPSRVTIHIVNDKSKFS